MSHKDVLRKAEEYCNVELKDKALKNSMIRCKKYTPLNTMENMGNQKYPDDGRYVKQTFEDLLQHGLSFTDAIRTMGCQTRSTNYQNNNYNRQRNYPPRNNYRQPQQQNHQPSYNNGNRQRYNNYQNRPEIQRNQNNHASTIPPLKGIQVLRKDNKNYDNFAYLENGPHEYYYHNNYNDDEYYSDDPYWNDDYYRDDEETQSGKDYKGELNEGSIRQSSVSIQQNAKQQRVPQVIPAIQSPPIEEQPRNQRNKGKGPADQRPRPLKYLIKLSPKLRRELHVFTSTRRKIEPSLNIKDIDNKLDSTAAYSTVHIQEKPVTYLYYTGAAKSCISRTLMDDLEMEIQKSSSTRFTLGNGAIQASQGIIKDVEIQIGNFVKTPITLEVLTDKGIKTTRQIKIDSSDANGDTEETDEKTTDDTKDYTSFESDYTDSTSEEDVINENQDPIEFYLKNNRVKYPLQLEEWIAPNGTTCYQVYTGESLPLTGNETTYLTGELSCTNSQELHFYPYPALYQPNDYQETSSILPGQI
ncbi:hypothetical protein INT45_008801 [Circinella minor]|uniref:Uncharacterized protein n=1 Tax=Circinella minor TaxID=1195481 RepID=A0A8H7RS22_9FUNG|nr:hypothetical protein INT45_008801 [Circinella minor]